MPNHYTRVDDIRSDPEFAVSEREGQRIVRTPVQIDADNAPRFDMAIRSQLAQVDTHEVVVDLRDSLEVDESAAEVLVAAVEKAIDAGKELVIGGPLTPEVAFLLDLEPLKDSVRLVNLYESGVLG